MFRHSEYRTYYLWMSLREQAIADVKRQLEKSKQDLLLCMSQVDG